MKRILIIFVYMDLDTLISYHKQEASEELTYITIIFTVILGVFGYIGSAKKIEPLIRIAISVVFAAFITTFLLALAGSLKIHDALHEEIRNYTLEHSKDFIGHEKSKLYITLSQLKPHQSDLAMWMGAVLGLLVILGILTYGERKVFSLRKRKSSTR